MTTLLECSPSVYQKCTNYRFVRLKFQIFLENFMVQDRNSKNSAYFSCYDEIEFSPMHSIEESLVVLVFFFFARFLENINKSPNIFLIWTLWSNFYVFSWKAQTANKIEIGFFYHFEFEISLPFDPHQNNYSPKMETDNFVKEWRNSVKFEEI